jgi:tyrosyl-tRNA synthetase
MLLLGVTAMSLLTTPAVIMASIHFLAKDGHQPVIITGGCTTAIGAKSVTKKLNRNMNVVSPYPATSQQNS